jgi:hypothetical protein
MSSRERQEQARRDSGRMTEGEGEGKERRHDKVAQKDEEKVPHFTLPLRTPPPLHTHTVFALPAERDGERFCKP